MPRVDLLAAGLGLPAGWPTTEASAPDNDARSLDDEDVRDGQGPESGWRSWFGAVVRETLDSTGTFRT